MGVVGGRLRVVGNEEVHEQNMDGRVQRKGMGGGRRESLNIETHLKKELRSGKQVFPFRI